jgi:hypothetical protein
MSRNVSILSVVVAIVVLSVLGVVTVAFAEHEEELAKVKIRSPSATKARTR